ncbi:MAG: DNA cytosine methyltransferase [Saprospiraceae bacterium]
MEDDYYVEKIKLNALEYGVPQSRERIFVVGFLKSLLPGNYPYYKWA